MWFTLDSIIMQEGIEYEVIITNDGSSNNLFDEIITFFKNRCFVYYKIIGHDEKRGTTNKCV